MYNQIRIARLAISKSDKTKRTIYLRVFPTWQAGKNFTISTKITLHTSKWCDTKKQAKGTSIESQRVNIQLNKLEETCYKLFDEYIKSVDPPKLNDYKAFIEFKIFNKGNGGIKPTIKVNDLFTRYVRLHSSELGEVRKRRYQFVGGKVNEFNTFKFGKSDVELDVLSREWRQEFKQFLMVSFKYKTSTLNGYLKVLHAVVNDAYQSDYLKSNPFKNCGFDRCEENIKYLTKDELAKIERIKSNDERLMRATKMFLFASYTGLSYADMKTLKRTELERDSNGEFTIVKHRNKTEVRSLIPLNKKAMEIINEYHLHPLLSGTNLLLPVIHLNDYNQLLKMIAIHCKINKNLTSHMARHTFATTIWISNGGTLESLQRILGHKKIQTTEKYGKITNQKVKDEASLVFTNQTRRGAISPDKNLFNDLINDNK
jgi:integrase